MIRETTEERTRKRWKQAMELFEQSLALAPFERERLLKSACQQDPELRETLDNMLSASRDAESSGFLESPAWTYQPIESNPQAIVGRKIGAYRLTQYLAKGGMGIVYLGERADKFFRRQVAIKFINANTGAKLYSRFRREIQILADLKHPNLVMLYDAGRMGDGRPYIVMEYVKGETLRDWAARHGPASPATVVEILKQACAGLHAAHEAGVIHRDIKPANIILNDDNGRRTVKVLDFGVASRQQHGDSGVSSTHGAIGTLLYMSPEQLQSSRGRDLTPASDVYALGLIVYELLTGRPANDGQSQAEVITKHLYETPPPPSRANPNVPTNLDRVVMKALAKDARNRYPSAAEFAQALEAGWHSAPTQAHPPAEAPPSAPLPPVNASPSVPAKAKKPMRVARLGAAVAAAILLVIMAYQFRPHAPAPGPTAPPPAGGGLYLNLGIKRPEGRTFDSCRFALFKSGVRTRPAAISPDNALVIFDEVNSQGTSKVIKNDRVPPGRYLASLECTGFQPFTEEVDITENPNRPGWATVPLRLEPK